jgi:hypothetical protein
MTIRHARPSSSGAAPRLSRLAVRQSLASLVALALALALAACSSDSGTSTGGANGGTNGSTSAASATATRSASVPASPTAGGYTIQVYFSKHPDSDNNINAVFPRGRVSPTVAVATYATQQLIAGPTAAETASGYYTELHGALGSASNCGGPDFQLMPNTHVDPHTGTASPQHGTWALKFCRTVSLPGDLSGARITAQIGKTLTQFSTITRVQILNSSGHCFNDLSGQDNC